MFYQKGLNECLRILGADHPLTGQFYVDIAVVMLKNNAIDQMIIYLEKAYAVFNLPQNVLQSHSLRRRTSNRRTLPARSQ